MKGDCSRVIVAVVSRLPGETAGDMSVDMSVEDCGEDGFCSCGPLEVRVNSVSSQLPSPSSSERGEMFPEMGEMVLSSSDWLDRLDFWGDKRRNEGEKSCVKGVMESTTEILPLESSKDSEGGGVQQNAVLSEATLPKRSVISSLSSLSSVSSWMSVNNNNVESAGVMSTVG